MTKTIDAVYENGVFRPLEVMKLADGQRVRLAVETEADPASDQASIDRLMTDPTFRIPSAGSVVFQYVEPIQGTGIPASTMIVEDRR